MSTGGIETYYENDQWKNWDETERADVGESHGSREDAVAEGRQLAQDKQVEHLVRDENATIVARDEDGDGPSTDELRKRNEQGFESRHGTAEPVADR